MALTFKAFVTKNNCYKAAQKMPDGSPEGFILHSTGANNPYLKRYVDAPDIVGKNIYGNHWNVPMPAGANGKPISQCCHGFIGKDEKGNVLAAHILPYEWCCWNSGSGSKGSYNFTPAYIQFEICEDGLNDRDYFEKAFDLAARVVAELMQTYPTLKLENVISHKEANKRGYASAHGDPENWLSKFGKDMDWFREKVKSYIQTAPETTENEKLYRVQIGAFANKQNAENYLEKAKAAGFDGFIVEVSAAKPAKSVDEIALEVIRGDWGNGEERIKRLTAAGYNAAEVQARVDVLMR